MHNPNLKGGEIDTFKSEAGTHYFTMSPQRWIKETNAIAKKQYNILQNSNSINKIEMLDKNNNFNKLQ